MAERTEWGMPGMEGRRFVPQSDTIFFFFIHVCLWEKSCSFVGKIMSVCGIIAFSLWEKFGEQSIVLDNSRQYVGKNYRIIYVYLSRYHVSRRLFDRKFAET